MITVLTAMVGGLLAGGALAVAIVAAPGGNLHAEATPTSIVAPASPEDGGVPDALVPPDASSSEPRVESTRVDPATDRSCRRGMRLVAGDDLQLGQPRGGRPDWPRPSAPVLAPFAVGSFCIDRREARSKSSMRGA
jgi:hypothetical protein